MELNSLKHSAILSREHIDKAPLRSKIFDELVDMIYRHNLFAITTQLVASLGLVIGLWQINSHQLIITWFIYMLAVYSSWCAITLYYRRQSTAFRQHNWLILLSIFIFLAGTGWGFAGSVLIPINNLIHQTFVIILIVAITSGSIAFFSPMIFIYALFLFPALIPFDIWLFAQGDIYILLGICGLIYMLIIFSSCYYLNRFLVDTLKLRYKNMSLDTLNQLLETRINNRTDELEKSLALTKSTLESTADGILVLDLNGNVEYYNQKFLDMWQVSDLFITSPTLQTLIDELVIKIKQPEEFRATLEEINNNPAHENFNEIVVSDNKVFEWYSKPHWVRNLIAGHAWSFRDITIRKQMERQLVYQANHDLLTGLPNRTLLYDRINYSIAYARRYQTQLFLLFLDLDNFKLINDNLGHNVGDVLLQEIAHRLKDNTRESDTVSRFGGDEFIVLLITNRYGDITKLSQKILDAIAKPIQLHDQEFIVTASMGVCVYPNDGENAETLLKNADMAMYLAKNQGRNNFKLYDETMKKRTEKSLEIQIELRNALARNEFFLLYQPTINLKTGEITGAEALVRWKHPQKGVIQPLHFIPAAEESRIIVLLGEWVLRNACLQNKIWQNMGYKPIKLAINVSGIQLMRDNFADFVRLALNDSQLNPEYIELELTESIIMNDKKQNLRTLERLKDMGVYLTIDDFGTGYSSLNYLREFPVNKLKIDQSFVRDCYTSSNDASIITAIIAMGHGLKLRVLAEGIETIDQLNFLKQTGCDEGQGFFFDQPMSAKAFTKLLESDFNYNKTNKN
ncbi:Bacteriophytochrome cph2 [Legionella massiliensis]|uniref:cyclic-guanylate-specific phosphodiesterase n=1 Tax=Legionella massiliensis TaxID=1034943 RepID=A0A078KW50_9GAMM|nr:bifunctional diguanylate cyclase/phosphodiesterase [Legionella massiliensis]CDZ75908.1 Bacteriophytochrome cph2 [Legionella massiliensis]CEE11646.1 Phytochrome-like protein cph2 [Legionella massiliensis]